MKRFVSLFLSIVCLILAVVYCSKFFNFNQFSDAPYLGFLFLTSAIIFACSIAFIVLTFKKKKGTLNIFVPAFALVILTIILYSSSIGVTQQVSGYGITKKLEFVYPTNFPLYVWTLIVGFIVCSILYEKKGYQACAIYNISFLGYVLTKLAIFAVTHCLINFDVQTFNQVYVIDYVVIELIFALTYVIVYYVYLIKKNKVVVDTASAIINDSK